MMSKILIAVIAFFSFPSISYAGGEINGTIIGLPSVIEIIDDEGNTIKYDTSKLNTASIYNGGSIKFTMNGMESKCWLPRLGNLKHDFNFVLREESGKEFDIRVYKDSKVLGQCQGKTKTLMEMYIPKN